LCRLSRCRFAAKHPRPYVRKRATLLTYKIFVNYPEALRPTFPRLKEKLQDPDTCVVSAAVNVICELARKNPKNYLSLAPLFFKILTSSGNNWMLIKIVKLLGALCPLEPRLAKKLSEPITNIISTTPAKSLLYECISTATTGMTGNKALMELCTEKLRSFVMEADPNLKFLGLVGLCNVIVVYPRMIAGHKDIILACLDDEDVTIRMRVLELLAGMASRKNLPDIVKKIRQHIDTSDGAYRDRLVSRLILTCQQENYALIADFEWYIATLVDLSHLRGLTDGRMIADQMMDVVVRVDAVREFAVSKMLLLLRDPHILSESTTDAATQEVLFAAAWIVGEYSQYVSDYREALNALTQNRVSFLPSHVQGSYVQSAFKVLISGVHASTSLQEETVGGPNATEELRSLFDEQIQIFTQSIHVEVQERACFSSSMVKNIFAVSGSTNQELVNALVAVFMKELNPVAPKAQRKVKPPEGIDLDAWIGEELLPEPPAEEVQSNVFFLDQSELGAGGNGGNATEHFMPKQSKKELKRLAREQRKLEKLRKKDPFYLAMQQVKDDYPSVDDIPIAQLDETIDIDLSHMEPEEKGKKKKTKKKGKGGEEEPEQVPDSPPHFTVKAVVDEPDGDEAPDSASKDALDIDINAPLRVDEVLPEMKGYGRQTAEQFPDLDDGKKKKKTKKKEKEEKKKKKKKDEDSEEEAAEDSEDDKQKKKKKKKDKEGDDMLIDTALVVAEEPLVEEETKRKKKEKKEKKSRKEKSEDKPAASSSAPSAASASVPSGKARLLCGNDSLSVSVMHQADPSSPKQVCTHFIFENKSGEGVEGVKFETKDSMNTKVMTGGDATTTPFEVGMIAPGGKMVRKVMFSCESFVRPQKMAGEVTYSGGSVPFQLVIPCSTFVTPSKASKEEFADAVTGGSSGHLSSVKVKVPPEKMKWAIEAMAEILNVSMIECVAGAASFFGTTTAGQPVAVLVKAKSSGLALEIRSFDENFVASLSAEAAASIAADM